jgi:hypothetical protein
LLKEILVKTIAEAEKHLSPFSMELQNLKLQLLILEEIENDNN